jgi:hypothetical protein
MVRITFTCSYGPRMTVAMRESITIFEGTILDEDEVPVATYDPFALEWVPAHGTMKYDEVHFEYLEWSKA